MKLSGLAREEFLRSLIMGAQLQARPCTHHADLLHKATGLRLKGFPALILCNKLLHKSAARL